jgi:plastocyanin
VTRPLFLALAASLVLAACSKNEPPAQTAQAPAAAPAAAPGAQNAVKSLEPAPNTGKVLQVQQAGSYTYAEVEGPQGQRAWVAGTTIEIKPGDTVQWGDYSVMRNFTAKSINRTFDTILFVSSWGPLGAPIAATPAHGSLPAPTLGAADASSSGVVKSVASGGGYSYIEVERDGQTMWVAAPETAVKPGDKVQWSGGSEMRNFTAKSLGRTFDRIIFASSASVAN